jgi:putative transposase
VPVATQYEEEMARRAERARRLGLFRYEVIQDAVDPALSARQRGELVREIAARVHSGPQGEPVQVSRTTVDRWIRSWRIGGFEALVPNAMRVEARTPAEVLELAAALKRENPARTAVQVARVLRAHSGWAPSERTLQRHFARLGLDRAEQACPKEVFGRFEATRSNELWVGDAMHGPLVAGRKTILFAFLDDRSRAVMAARFGFAEDTVRLAVALRPALAARGIPEGVYLDNGSPFVDSWLMRACAVLGIKLVHSRPGRPEGRGKIERYYRTVRGQFVVETGHLADRPAGQAAAALAELNRAFTAWVETEYHCREHSETGQPPLARWQQGWPENSGPRLPHPELLREAFLWSEWRTVTKTALVRLHANSYQVEPALAGRKVELVFDPFDLETIEVRHAGRSHGTAVPFVIRRHSHPKARPELPPEQQPEPTGVNYLALLDQAHTEHLAGRINYQALLNSDSDSDSDSDSGGEHGEH